MRRLGTGWFGKLLAILGLRDEATQFESDQERILRKPIHFRQAQSVIARTMIILIGGFLWAIFAFGLFTIKLTPARPVSIQTGPLIEHVRFVLYELRYALIPPAYNRGDSVQERWEAYQEHVMHREPSEYHERDPELFALPFTILFSVQVFRHVWSLVFGFLLAYRIAAHYVTDIFDLNHISDGERFLLQSAFGSAYNVLSIQDGAVPEAEKESNLYKIGGPGYVRVHLENAALFETFERNRRIIHPSGDEPRGMVLLHPFERLRNVVDLRDQVIRMDEDGRTREGIPVRAENIRVTFSIHRPPGQVTTFKHPYPFDEQALYRLNYYRPGDRPWTYIMEVGIRSSIWSFFTSHRLDEFLANIGAPELAQNRQREELLRREAARVGAGDNSSEAGPAPLRTSRIRTVGVEDDSGTGQPDLPAPSFMSRPEITRVFYESLDDVSDQPLVDIIWIDVGTWALQDESILSRHQEAWRLSNENMRLGSQAALNKARRESAVMEGLRLIQEVPLLTYQRGQEEEESAYETMRNLLLAYRGKLMGAVELFEEEGSGNTPAAQRIRAILNFVEQLINFHSTATDLDGTSDQNGAAAANNADRKGISVVIPRDERDVSEAEKQELRRLIAKQTGSSEDDVEILFGGAE